MKKFCDDSNYKSFLDFSPSNISQISLEHLGYNTLESIYYNRKRMEDKELLIRKVLVTGAAGYVGHRLIEELLRRGVEVWL